MEFIGSVFGGAKDKAYRNADLFVLPSYAENFGSVVVEALSYGVPVIAKSVSFGLKSACNATFIACDPDIN